MYIKIRLQSHSKPLEFEDVTNTYTKGGLFCLYLKEKNMAHKYPLCNILSVQEFHYD
jgi:hypothetical protein